jgi:hypothetical protein
VGKILDQVKADNDEEKSESEACQASCHSVGFCLFVFIIVGCGTAHVGTLPGSFPLPRL